MFEQVRRNRRASQGFVLVLGLLLVLAAGAAVELVLPGSGAILGLPLGAVAFAFYAYRARRHGDAWLRDLAGALPADAVAEKTLSNIVEELMLAFGMSEVPDLYVIEDQGLNAFATEGPRGKSALVVTRGLLKSVSRSELQAAVAHELAHIKHGDTRFLTLACALASAVTLVASLGKHGLRSGVRTEARVAFPGRVRGSGNAGALMYLKLAVLLLVLYGASRLARLLFHGISAEREYLADAGAIIATRDPEALLALLLRVESTPSAYPSGLMPLMLAAPNFDVTHPPLRRRIQILSDLLRLPPSAELQTAYATAYRRNRGRTMRLAPATPPVELAFRSPRTDAGLDDPARKRCGCGLECEVMPGAALRCPHCRASLT